MYTKVLALALALAPVAPAVTAGFGPQVAPPPTIACTVQFPASQLTKLPALLHLALDLYGLRSSGGTATVPLPLGAFLLTQTVPGQGASFMAPSNNNICLQFADAVAKGAFDNLVKITGTSTVVNLMVSYNGTGNPAPYVTIAASLVASITPAPPAGCGTGGPCSAFWAEVSYTPQNTTSIAEPPGPFEFTLDEPDSGNSEVIYIDATQFSITNYDETKNMFILLQRPWGGDQSIGNLLGDEANETGGYGYPYLLRIDDISSTAQGSAFNNEYGQLTTVTILAVNGAFDQQTAQGFIPNTQPSNPPQDLNPTPTYPSPGSATQ